MKKKNLATTALAVVMAVTLLVGGGTFAYLQSSSADVVNKFKTNKVAVELAETTGSDYNVIPGTAQSKDPKITVDNTVDSYVYAIVTDNLEGLVNYKIADGWMPLTGWQGAHTKVYYREVAKDAAVKTFSVLAGDQVSYDATLDNSNMVNPDGSLKDGLNLTFSAYAIKKDSFATAEKAFETGYATAATSADLEAGIKAGKTVVLTDNVTMPSAIDAKDDVNIVGNGHTIAPSSGDRVLNLVKTEKDVVINIKDAVLAGPEAGSYTRGISLYGNKGAVTLNVEDSTVSAGYYALNVALDNPNVTMNIKNSRIEGWAALNFHSENTKATFENCTLVGTSIYSGESDNFATVVINKTAPGCNLTFRDCRIEANQKGAAVQNFLSVRAANTTVTVENCEFYKDGVKVPSDVSALAPYVGVYKEHVGTFNFVVK